MQVGSKVIFIGCSKEQSNFGGPYSGDTTNLIIGAIYVVESIEEHSWHTHISLQGIKGDFNSACFEE